MLCRERRSSLDVAMRGERVPHIGLKKSAADSFYPHFPGTPGADSRIDIQWRCVHEATWFLGFAAGPWRTPGSACPRDVGAAEVHFWRHHSVALASWRLQDYSWRF